MSQNITDAQIAGSNSIIGNRGSDILNGTSGDDIITTSAANGASDRYARDTINIGEIQPGSIGNDVITDFDANNFRGGESNFDTLNFTFNGQDFSLSTGEDIVDFVRYIESDGDIETDAILDGNDIIFVFNRNEDGGITDSIRLEGILNDDGITQYRLNAASIDSLTDEDVFVAFEETPPAQVNLITGNRGSDVLEGTSANDIITTSAANGASDRYARDTINIGEIQPGSIGNDVITDFDANNFRGGENNFDTLNFTFNGQDFSLSTGKDVVDFVRYIESDGDIETDAILDGNDIIFVFNRNEDGGITDSIRLEDVFGDDGITQGRLNRASIDRLSDADVFVAFDDDTPSDDDGANPDDDVTNNVPVVEAPLAILAAEGDDSLTLNLLNGASDIDTSDTLSIVNVSDLPNGVTLDGNILTLDPSASDFQSLGEGETQDITVSYDIIDNNGGSVAQTATITVTGTNDAPTVDGAIAVSANEGTGSVTFDLLEGASDIDNGAVLTAVVNELPDGFTFGDGAGDLVFDTNSPAFEAIAEGEQQVITIDYIIRDENNAEVAQNLTVIVTGTNDAPVVTGSVSGAVNEGDSAVTVDLLEGASDVDNGAVLSVRFAPSLPPGVTVDGTTLIFDPSVPEYEALAEGQIEQFNISYDVVDENDAAVTRTVTLTLTGTNDAPVVESVLNAEGNEDGAAFTVDLLEGASDVDTNAELSIVLADDTLLPVGIDVDGSVLTVDPASSNFQNLAAGEELVITVNYDVVDGLGGSTSQSATITLMGTNDGPVLGAALSASTTENAAPISLDLITGTSDIDASDVLSVELIDDLPEGFALEGTVLTLDPNNAVFDALGIGDSIDFTINYNITDGNGASVAQTASFNIAGANDAPILTGSLDVPTAVVGGEFLFFNFMTGMPEFSEGETVTFNPTTLFSDPDEGDSLTFTVTSLDGTALPAWITFDSVTGEVTAMPEPEDVGLQTLLVTATDSFGASTSQPLFVVATEAVAPSNIFFPLDSERQQATVFETSDGVDGFRGTFASDTFILNPDGGTDSVQFSFASEDNPDTVIIRGASMDEVTFSVPQTVGFTRDVILTYPDGSTVYLGTFFSSTVSFIFEEDGITLTPEESRQLVLQDFFTDGDDIITGIQGTNVFEGGRGDDFISGDEEADTFIFNIGDGNDIYVEDPDSFNPTEDVVEIRGYNLEDATFTSVTPASDDLLISFSNGDSITLIRGIEDAEDADEVVIFGGEEFNIIDDDNFDVLRFDDAEISLDEVINLIDDSFPEFDEIVLGDDGDNTLEGGAGDDYLAGGLGDDTYIYTGGNDTFEETFSSGDILIEGFSSVDADITLISPVAPIFSFEVADQLVLDFGNGNTLTLISPTDFEQITFAGDGMTLSVSDLIPPDEGAQAGTNEDDTIRGNDEDETIEGGLGNDVLIGGEGSDTYIFNQGDGRDIIAETTTFNNEADINAIEFRGYNIEDAIFTGVNDFPGDLLVTFNGTSDSILINGGININFSATAANDGVAQSDNIDIFIFDDGSLTFDEVLAISLTQRATDGDDIIDGFALDDIIFGDAGNDLIRGGSRDDEIFGGSGDDDIFGQDGDDALFGGEGNDELSGDDGEDNLNGGDGEDSLSGGNSTDILTGGQGDDFLAGGAGDDDYIFNFGDGNDVLFDSAGENDSIDLNGYNFEDAIFTSIDDGRGDLLVSFENSTDSIIIRDGTEGFGAGVETFEFDDMTVTIDDILIL